MSARLQVVMSDEELAEVRAAAAREGLTVSEWARQALRRARLRHSGGDPERKIAAVRAAARHQFPVGDIEAMLTEIEQGYQDE